MVNQVRDSQFVRGAERLGRRITTITALLDLPALTDQIGSLLLQRTLRRFKAEVTPDNLPWAALKQSTLRRKKQLGYGDKQKLQRTDKMRSAIRLIRGSAAGSVYTNTGAGVRIGITDPEIVEYARVQNLGSKDGRIPARRFLGIGRLDVKAVDSLLRRVAKKVENTR